MVSAISPTVSIRGTLVSVPYFAQSSSYYYGEGTYNNQDTYNGQVHSNSGGIGDLVNTGTAIGLTVTVGAVLIFGALFMRVIKRTKKDSTDSQQN